MSSSYGTAKSGVGISAMSVLRPDLMIKCSIPVVMAGIIAVSEPNLVHYSQMLSIIQIYGLVVSVLISSKCSSKNLFYFPRAPVDWRLTIHKNSGTPDDSLCWFSATRRGLKCRPFRSRSWFCYWNCWRRGCSRDCATTSSLRRDGKYSSTSETYHSIPETC